MNIGLLRINPEAKHSPVVNLLSKRESAVIRLLSDFIRVQSFFKVDPCHMSFFRLLPPDKKQSRTKKGAAFIFIVRSFAGTKLTA